ncbi:MAG TPA: PAS domain-containing protein [Caulobacteraceae bacterium]
MFHSNTERLIDYWRVVRGEAPFPRRTTVDPGAFADLLPQVFILGREAPGRYRFRLSGGFVADLHGRELKGEQALPLWLRKDRARVQAAVELCRGNADPIVVNTEVICQGQEPIPMEILFAPLANAQGDADRYLGLYQPTGLIQRLEEGVLRELAMKNVMSTGSALELEPRLRLAVINGREVA